MGAFAINDKQNVILLRRDLHYLFDQRRFAFVVKRSEDQSTQLVTHSLIPLRQRGARELAHLYHNRCLQPLRGIATVQVYNTETAQYAIKDLRAAQVKEFSSLFGPSSRSRSVSPRKRQFNPDATDCIDSQSEDEQGAEEDWMEVPRGRRRKRSWDYDESVPDLATSMTTLVSAATSQVRPEAVSDETGARDQYSPSLNVSAGGEHDESSRKRSRLEPPDSHLGGGTIG
ncbi:hypothetical protein TARUN_9414 [Trichoderma arundinaceum]|uniref:HNH nuclease domain-containing protein n=1 Tax=Trichoderma arundinaceum TaxID=490622 RepID=A0A395NAB8_TRIAR|nr:hypothetical protein TARUN_9414 [Trichoderma arundinaceum]